MSNKKNLPNIPIYIGDWEKDCNTLIEFKGIDQYKNEFKRDFIRSVWKSQQTYTSNFDLCPKTSGVYAIESCNMNIESNDFLRSEIIYIGKAKNLMNRKRGHEVLRIARPILKDCLLKFYWFETNDYHNLERMLIEIYKPIINTTYGQ